MMKINWSREIRKYIIKLSVEKKNKNKFNTYNNLVNINNKIFNIIFFFLQIYRITIVLANAIEMDEHIVTVAAIIPTVKSENLKIFENIVGNRDEPEIKFINSMTYLIVK